MKTYALLPRFALACFLPALAFVAPGCAAEGSTVGELDADANFASGKAGRRGSRAVELDLLDPDLPVNEQVTIAGARNLEVTVLELNNIVDDLRVRDGGNTPVALLADDDRIKGFLPYKIIVPGDTVRFSAGGLGAIRAQVRDARGERPDNLWQIDQLENGGELNFDLPGARGLRVQLTFHDLIEGEQVLHIESAAGAQDIRAEDLARFGGADQNVFRVPGDTVTVSVNPAVRSNGNPGSVEIAVTEDKAL